MSRNPSPRVTAPLEIIACHAIHGCFSCVTLTSASSAMISSLGGSPSLARVYRAVATVEEILVSFYKRQIKINRQVNSTTNLWTEETQILWHEVSCKCRYSSYSRCDGYSPYSLRWRTCCLQAFNTNFRHLFTFLGRKRYCDSCVLPKNTAQVSQQGAFVSNYQSSVNTIIIRQSHFLQITSSVVNNTLD